MPGMLGGERAPCSTVDWSRDEPFGCRAGAAGVADVLPLPRSTSDIGMDVPQAGAE